MKKTDLLKKIIIPFLCVCLLSGCSDSDSSKKERGKIEDEVKEKSNSEKKSHDRDKEKSDKKEKNNNKNDKSEKKTSKKDKRSSVPEIDEEKAEEESDEDSSQSSGNRLSLNKSEEGSDSIYFKSMPDDRQTIINNISIETENNDDLLMVVLTNNNSFAIPDLDVQAIFYNNGKMIGSEKDGHDAFLPGHSVASRLEIPAEATEFEISIDVDWDYGTSYRNWTDQVSVESNIGSKCVMISFTNNSDTDIDELEYVVALYKNGKFVDMLFPKDIYDVRSGEIIVEEASTYSRDFDDYKIYINQAQTFY